MTRDKQNDPFKYVVALAMIPALVGFGPYMSNCAVKAVSKHI